MVGIITSSEHLHIEVHLLLRVHDVEVVIRRNEPKGRFICIRDATGALSSLSSGDGYNPSYGTRPIDRGSGGVLEYFEGSDIIRGKSAEC